MLGVGGLQRFQKYGPLNIQVGEKKDFFKNLGRKSPPESLGKRYFKETRDKINMC